MKGGMRRRCETGRGLGAAIAVPFAETIHPRREGAGSADTPFRQLERSSSPRMAWPPPPQKGPISPEPAIIISTDHYILFWPDVKKLPVSWGGSG